MKTNSRLNSPSFLYSWHMYVNNIEWLSKKGEFETKKFSSNWKKRKKNAGIIGFLMIKLHITCLKLFCTCQRELGFMYENTVDVFTCQTGELLCADLRPLHISTGLTLKYTLYFMLQWISILSTEIIWRVVFLDIMSFWQNKKIYIGYFNNFLFNDNLASFCHFKFL